MNLTKLNWAAAIAQGATGLGILIYFLIKNTAFKLCGLVK